MKRRLLLTVAAFQIAAAIGPAAATAARAPAAKKAQKSAAKSAKPAKHAAKPAVKTTKPTASPGAARPAPAARSQAPSAAPRPDSSGSGVWKAEVPAQMKESTVWIDLAHSMMEQGLHYGALATANRMRIFFQDLPTKEVAYHTMVGLIDRGYPFPIYEYFMGADIDPEEPYDFANSYHLYRSVLSRQKGMYRWADHYLSRVDQVHFRKYILLKALELYQKDDLKAAEENLSKILSQDLPLEDLPLVRKATRTLARIHFERGDYDKALDIYNGFLLNLNPVSPSDWLEAAWSYYHLKKYEQALGMLYNLESDSVDATVSLEKFNIRALIYRDQCALTNMENLVQDFDRVFGKVIEGIKTGDPLASFPILRSIEIPGNQYFSRINQTLLILKDESAMIERLPEKQRSAAEYIFKTEMRMLNQQLRAHLETALQNAANQLILVSEQLRYLKFDNARSKFSPESVFKQAEKKPEGQTEQPEEFYELRWIQYGDYWRDERLKFRGVLPNLCSG